MSEAKQQEHKNVFMALASAQSQMGPVVKGSTNPHFKSKYADLADVMSVALPALNANGISAWHSTVQSEGVSYMRTTLSHGDSDTHMNCDIPLLVSKNDMQGMKSATTYAKRIGIESLTGIAPEDDDGNAASAGGAKASAPVATITEDQAMELDDMLTQAGISKAKLFDTASRACGYGISRLIDLPAAKFDGIKGWITKQGGDHAA